MFEYMYNFKGGGWNTEFADSESEAYAKAVERWKDSPSLTPLEGSFMKVEDNKERYEMELRSFW